MEDKRCRPVRLPLLRLKLRPPLIMDGELAKPLSGLLLVLLSLQGQAKSRLPTWCTALLALGWHMATQWIAVKRREGRHLENKLASATRIHAPSQD
jgi:hypothetical protein